MALAYVIPLKAVITKIGICIMIRYKNLNKALAIKNTRRQMVLPVGTRNKNEGEK